MNLRKLHRRSDTGRITTAADTNAHPELTTTETLHEPFTNDHVNALGALAACANKHGLREATRRLLA